MVSTKGKKWGIIIVVILVPLIVGGVLAFRAAVGLLKDKVAEALGPDSEIKELSVGWSAVEVVGLRIRGSQDWPAKDTLRAGRVVIVPSLSSLLSGQIQVGSITVVRPYLSAWRTREGKLRVLPSLLERPKTKAQEPSKAPAPGVTISRIRLQDGVVELFDATVAQPPLKIRLEQIQATVRNVAAPTLAGKTRFDLSGVVKGVQQDGRVAVSGWAVVASKDSSVETRLKSVDLVPFQPYFTKATEARVQKGALDLDLDSEVSNKKLRAPGKVLISDLEFAPGRGALDTFMGVPRVAVVDFLKGKDNNIEVDFVIEGDIDNPQFSLNKSFSARVASALTESIKAFGGVEALQQKGLEKAGEMATGVEAAGRKAVEEKAGEAGKAAEGALKGVKGLLGGEKK